MCVPFYRAIAFLARTLALSQFWAQLTALLGGGKGYSTGCAAIAAAVGGVLGDSSFKIKFAPKVTARTSPLVV